MQEEREEEEAYEKQRLSRSPPFRGELYYTAAASSQARG